MNKKYYIFYFTLLLGSCNNPESVSEKVLAAGELNYADKEMPLPEFVTWVADKENELVKTKEIKDIIFNTAYMPGEVMAYMELKNKEYSQSQFKEISEHYSAMSYFNFRIELKEGSGEVLKYNLSSAGQYNERLNYMAFNMQKDIYLVQNSDTLYPGLFHYERIFEVAPYATAMLAFDNEKFKKDEEFTIVYNDRLFNKGLIKFNYRPKQLIDLPNISGV